MTCDGSDLVVASVMTEHSSMRNRGTAYMKMMVVQSQGMTAAQPHMMFGECLEECLVNPDLDRSKWNIRYLIPMVPWTLGCLSTAMECWLVGALPACSEGKMKVDRCGKAMRWCSHSSVQPTGR